SCALANPIGQAISNQMLSTEVTKEANKENETSTQESMAIALGGEEKTKVDAEPIDKIDVVITSNIMGQVGG
ncbi:ABC transporter permease, partial [Escherichia coli]|nr:ABC transporter permease [Escherichia coli]